MIRADGASTMTTTEEPAAPRPTSFLQDPAVALLGVVVAVAFALRALFLSCSAWLWSFAKPFDPAELTPWARSQMVDRDGIEPYALIALVVLQWLLTAAGVTVLGRLAARGRAAVVALLLVAVVVLANHVPPKPPLPDVSPDTPAVLMLIAGALIAAALLRWTMSKRFGLPTALAVALIPFCFVRSSLPSLLDFDSVLAPALRMHRGIPLSDIYLQYDLLPSLLARFWLELGGEPMGFQVVVATVLYVTMIGVFLVARRLFARPGLVATLLVSILLVRFYGVWGDPTAYVQVTPLRLDLWIWLVAVTLRVGLRHWLVGLVVACLCFFSRSIGILYLAAYVLALGADFLAARRLVPPAERTPLGRDARALAREVAPAFGLVAASFVVARLVFKGFGSEAVALYRDLGLGMLRVVPISAYWWLLALTGAVGWLAFVRRGDRGPLRGQAGIFTAALLLANSLYFFGRSHEHNLLNISIIVLFNGYLAFDLAWPTRGQGSLVGRGLLQLAPLVVIVASAYFYSGRALAKIQTQASRATASTAAPALDSDNVVPDTHCDEVDRIAPDRRVYFFSKNDFWYYAHCHVVPQGFMQPLLLSATMTSVTGDLGKLLDEGYKIFLPRYRPDVGAVLFPPFQPRLGKLRLVETPSFLVYQRP